MDRSKENRLYKFPISSGMDPFNWLLERSRYSKLLGTKDVGISDSLFWRRLNQRSPFMENNSPGIFPVKEFVFRLNVSRFKQLERLAGIVPLKLLVLKLIEVSCVITNGYSHYIFEESAKCLSWMAYLKVHVLISSNRFFSSCQFQEYYTKAIDVALHVHFSCVAILCIFMQCHSVHILILSHGFSSRCQFQEYYAKAVDVALRIHFSCTSIFCILMIYVILQIDPTLQALSNWRGQLVHVLISSNSFFSGCQFQEYYTKAIDVALHVHFSCVAILCTLMQCHSTVVILQRFLIEILSRRSCVIPPNSSKFPAPWHCSLPSFVIYTYCFSVSNGVAILPDCKNRAGGIVPLKKLVLRSNHNKLLHFPNSAGMFPEMVLFPKFRMDRLDKCPNEAGIAPLNKLFDKEIHFKLVQLLRLSGIDPDNSLKSRIRLSKDCKYISSLGISPSSRFIQIIKSLSLNKDLRLDGIFPLRKIKTLKSNGSSNRSNHPPRRVHGVAGKVEGLEIIAPKTKTIDIRNRP
nr:hypothetical protein THIOM_002471 [Ipomoea trifida]